MDERRLPGHGLNPQPPKGKQRAMLLTSTELGWAAGWWHLLDAHGNVYCDEPGAISSREWVADRERTTRLRLCVNCQQNEPRWSNARLALWLFEEQP